MNTENEIIIREKIKAGMTYFNKGDFFEAHEALESAWRLDHSNRKSLLQGLIQFSVGCHHAKTKNWVGAERVLARARGKLLPFKGTSSFVDIVVAISQLEDFLERIIRIKKFPNEEIELVVNPKLFYIEE